MTPDTPVPVARTENEPDHAHEWERGRHMADAFGVDGRVYACAICGVPREEANR